MTVLVPLDGFLRDGIGTPYVTGEMLLRTLCTNYRVVVCHEGPEEEARSWLARRGLASLPAAIHGGAGMLDHMARERVHGSLDIVFTPDTEVAREVFAQGVTTMLVASSDFVNPRWRPERKSWGQLKEEMA